MKNSKGNLILHPVRLKIIQSLLGGKKQTVQQMLEQYKDIPQATLYRHLNKLVEAKIVNIVEEHQVRGTIEKVYGINSFEEYIPGDHIDFIKDGIAYKQAKLHLSDAEFMEFVIEITKAFEKAAQKTPSPERTSRNITTIIIPEKQE